MNYVKYFESKTTTDSENSAENPTTKNFIADGIQTDFDTVVVAESYSGNFVDSLRQLLVQLCPLTIMGTYRWDGQSSGKFHTFFATPFSSVAELLLYIQNFGCLNEKKLFLLTPHG